MREDPQQSGILYAATERTVYFSIDDGENWNPLRLNMPASSIRDLVVHNSDLVVGTHGRSFWILDDIGPLRELSASQDTALFIPAFTYRFRRDTNSDTPLPPVEPAGQNPPDGAIINFYLKEQARSPVILDIVDSTDCLWVIMVGLDFDTAKTVANATPPPTASQKFRYTVSIEAHLGEPGASADFTRSD